MRRHFFLSVATLALATSLSDVDAHAQLQPAPPKLTPVPGLSPWTTYTASAQKGLADAITNWTQTATLVDVHINAAIVSDGHIVATPLSPAIFQQMTKDKVPLDIAQAFDASLSTAWATWTTSVRASGLQLYPSFAAYPGGYAPPTPNVATSLTAFITDRSSMTAPALSASLSRALGTHMKDLGAQAAVTDFANLVGSRFTTFTGCTVTSLMGSGPVPNYAPPYVTAGPVLNGQATMAAGGLANCHWLP